jgi:hypothetical protein
LRGKPQPSMTSRLLGREEATSGRRPKLHRPTKATGTGAVYGANRRRRPTAWHYSDTVAEWVFTILTFVHRPSLNYKWGGWHWDQGRRIGYTNLAIQKPTHHTHQASAALTLIQRLGTSSLSRPKLVYPTTSPPMGI